MFNLDKSLPIVDFSNFEFSQFGEAFLYGGSVLLIGLATVFAVLCILWLCLFIFRLVFHDLPSKKATKNKVAQVLTPVEKTVESRKADDGEIIAVIAAAIAMAENDQTGTRFKVVSFRRI